MLDFHKLYKKFDEIVEKVQDFVGTERLSFMFGKPKQQPKSPSLHLPSSFENRQPPPPPSTPPSKPNTQFDFKPSRSLSLSSKNGGCVFEPEFILKLKPEPPSEVTISTPGFIILMEQFDTKDSAISRRHPSKKLVIHDDRFIPSALRHKYGLNDPEQERKEKAQICLNRLNAKNSQQIIKDLLELQHEPSFIMQLLLDRATVNEDSPEKNSHLRNFAHLAIDLSSDKAFKRCCCEMSIATYEELVKSDKFVLNKVECILVWISYLVIGRVIKRRQFFKCLELAIKYQNGDNAVDLIRASLVTCGKFIDEVKWNESATFYRYIIENPPKSGYLLFLLNDLKKLRDSVWNEECFKPIQVKVAHEMDDTTLQATLYDLYMSWHEDPSFGTPRVPPKATIEKVVRAIFKNYVDKKITELDYSRWVGLLIENAEVDHNHFPTFITNSKDVVPESDLPGFYSILGGLYDTKQIKFQTIVSLGGIESPDFIDAIGESTYIDQREISEALAALDKGKINDNTIAALVMISDWSDTQEKNKTAYGRAVDFSRIVLSGIEEADDQIEPKDLFDKRKQYILEASEGISKALLKEILYRIISGSNLSDEFMKKAENYFSELKLY
ncbi:hypothetical protein TRFO_01585 [Tritrichomonas foetus]|uniref:Uncharacterized protein n=1 Tax=Tritrichomonas foetus TaxID=1144522 RepID=A0A1J4JXZ1_9EUKA|nr:hypothetical protein TRFO_01585 [Tritrichomonas foetus]|eukprot:OHT03859.1 hypothetical protein TRFO_01585 [Tritrichomonas foetus]